MESVVLDSSAVIAFHNPFDVHHQSIVAAISQSRARFQISTVTVMESLVACARVSEKVEGAMLADLTTCYGPFLSMDAEVAVIASRLRATGSLSTPDAIISASATKAGATLWTFDARLAKAHKGARLLE